MKYKIATAIFLLITLILVILVVRDKSLLKQAVVQTYNQWSSEINGAATLLATGATSPKHDDIDAIHLAYDSFNISSGRISGSIAFSSPAQETKGALANLCFELNAEFNGLINRGHPDKDRKFLASQFEQVKHSLPRTVSSINHLVGLNKTVEKIRVTLNKNYTDYLAQT